MTTMSRARTTAAVALCAMLSLPLAGRAQGQNATITGKVTSEFGNPLEGANVFITEMSLSVGTNARGDYTITIPSARVNGQQVVLRVRSFGYVPQMKPIRITAGAQTASFVLKQDVNRLEEVVVTGVTAGTSQKTLPFKVDRVDESSMPVPSANPLTQLQGKVPGAQIVSSSGRPGSSPSVMLRGPKSINGDGRGQGPLYIVDGVELQGSLSDINPQDIESVEIVKGAAASSLYGSRAGNGVIQITTKSGQNAAEGTRFTVRTEAGFGDIEREFALAQRHFLTMDETKTRFCTVSTATGACGQTVDLAEEALRVNQNADAVALSPVKFQNDYGIAASASKPNLRGVYQVEQFPIVYNPVGQLVTNGQFLNTSVDASGKSGGTSYFVSGSNIWQQGAIRYLSGLKRTSARVNVDQVVGDDWTFSARTYYARTNQDGANQDQGNGFFRITRNPVGVDLLATDNIGRLFIRSNPLNQGGQNYNPLYEFQNSIQRNQNDRFIGSLTSRYTPTSWLDFDGNFSYDRSNASVYFIEDKGFRTTGTSSRNQGQTERDALWGQSYNASFNANARKTFGEDFHTRYTARYLYEQQDGFNDFAYGNALAVPGLTTVGNATSGFSIGSSEQSIRSIGMTAGVDADYKERYIVGALVRRDGSSLFGAQNRYANYYRGSLAWRISDEPWWFLPTALNDMKFRASYGTAGGRPRFDAQYEVLALGTGGSISPVVLGNQKLRPETVAETELGFDAELFHRYGVNLTWAHDVATDQIIPIPPSAITGFQTQWKNGGTLDNKTWELSVNVPLITQRNLSWSARVNYDRTRTYITKLDVPPFFAGTSYQATGSIFRFAEGERYGTFYGRQFATSCSQLPSAYQSRCGSGKEWERNDEGYVVWTGGKGTQGGITDNLWNAVLPQADAPWGVAENWGMPIIVRDSTGTGLNVPLGNALPDYRLGFSQSFNYKRLFIYGQMDGSFGQYVWNQGRHWSLGDFMDAEEDQSGKSIGNTKPIGYYWRAPAPDNGAGVGGFYDFLQVNNRTLEKASYMKLREVNVSYNVGPVRGVGDWTVGLIGRNLHTFTDYTGFDPEVGAVNVSSTTGSSGLNAIDSFGYPNTRTFTFTISTKF